jgi:hypothetical protein
LESSTGQTRKFLAIKLDVNHRRQPMGEAMERSSERSSDKAISPLRRHAADALRRARKLPVGHGRNDLRQLATGLIWLEKQGLQTAAQERLTAILAMNEPRG